MTDKPSFYTKLPVPGSYGQPGASLDDVLLELQAINDKLSSLDKLTKFMVFYFELQWAAYAPYHERGEFARGDEWKATNDALKPWTES